MIDNDIDMALESCVFVSSHFLINAQLYCGIWKASTLRHLSTLLTAEMAQSKIIFSKIISDFEFRNTITEKHSECGELYEKIEKLYFMIRNYFLMVLYVSTLTIIVPPIGNSLYKASKSQEITSDTWEFPMQIS